MLKLKLSRQTISKNLQLYLPFLLANAVLVGINYIHLPDVFRVSLLYNVVVNRVPMGPVSGFAVNLPLVAQLVHLLFWMVWKSAVLN